MKMARMVTNKSLKTLAVLLPIFFLLSSSFVFADTPPCSNDPLSKDFQLVPCGANNDSVDLGYNDLIGMVNYVIKYFLYIIIPIIVAMITYAGFLYFGATDNPSNKEKAIHMLKSVAIGIFWVFFGYLIVYSLLKFLIPGANPL
jgi:hypothetical protein